MICHLCSAALCWLITERFCFENRLSADDARFACSVVVYSLSFSAPLCSSVAQTLSPLGLEIGL